MAIDRRKFLAGLGAGMAVLAHGGGVRAATAVGYIGVRYLKDQSRFVAVLTDAEGRTQRQVPLPDRGHGAAVRPDRQEVVVLARRPGNFAAAIPLRNGRPAYVFRCPANRHFQGHGTFDPTGRFLFTTENDFEAGRGVIGVYDAADAYRRTGELPSHGIGAHELVLMPDGKTLAVANGGILTHPDTGRTKLNLPHMEPSLAYVDLAGGRLMDRWAPPAGRESKLSIRHLAVAGDGRVVFACQDQGPPGDVLPLVATHRPGAAADPLQAPRALYRAMAGYCGSVAVDPSGWVVAVSAPRGNRVVFWDLASGAFKDNVILNDGCGIAAGQGRGDFLLSSGGGVLLSHRVSGARTRALQPPGGSPWDNHLTAIDG